MDKVLTIVNISEAKAQLSALIEKVTSSGTEIIIGKAGKPVAKIVRYFPEKPPKRIGLCKGQIWIADDFDEWTDALDTMFGMK